MIFNRKPGLASVWRHVPCVITPPAASPGHSINFKRSGVELESVLKSAPLKGVRLIKSQLDMCLEAEGVTYPTEGSGAKKRVLVVDLARALVTHALKDYPSTVQEKAIQKLVGGSSAARENKEKDQEEVEEGSGPESDTDPVESCPMEMLQILATLDLENKEQFTKVSQYATKALEKRMEREVGEKVQKAAKEAERTVRRKIAEEQAAAAKAGPSAPAVPNAASAPSSSSRPGGVVIAPHEKNRAPEALLSLLPPGISQCYMQVWRGVQFQHVPPIGLFTSPK